MFLHGIETVCINGMNKQVTIKDIAKIAGVSHSTVSRSLNDSSLVSAKTKQAIQRIARDLDFEFNASARSLSTRKTGTVGVIFRAVFENTGTYFYLDMMLKGIRHAFEHVSLDSIIAYPRNPYTHQSNIQRMIRMKKVDGLLIVHPWVSLQDWEFIQQSGIPYVVLHFKPKGVSYGDMDYIFADHEYGGYLAADYLIRSGNRRIVCITEDSSDLQFIERTAGFKRALAAADIDLLPNSVIKGECSFDFGYQMIHDHRGILDEIDAIFAEADIIALGMMDALKDLGLRVPEDIRIMGYDDIEFGHMYRPRLSTVHQPREEMVRRGCEQLVRLMNQTSSKGELQEVVLPELVIRQSC